MITYATTFFKPIFFEAALSVNLTTMLVMTTIFISKMESLPPTSAIKMIDIWLIICQMVPFVEVVLLTAMEYNREEKKEKKRRTKRKKKTKSKNLQTTSLVVASMDGEGHGQNGNITMPMNAEDEPEEEGRTRCWTPQLKTLGGVFIMFIIQF